ncbi:MAG: S24/S26 family peptidase, partial [Candidatus Marinimicrobia bacterium]|nr:S24/S26 family peptidase [Candidatus Neomarinimicrobiota bacterium]
MTEREMSVSSRDQLGLVQACAARGAPLRLPARGYSMHPFIRDRDVLTIEPLGPATPRLGEILAFRHPVQGGLAIHRLVGRTAAGWLLKGDNCEAAEGAVTPDAVYGRITRIDRGGR